MKKFEEEINKKVGTFDVVGHHNGVCCLFEEVKAFGKDWVSPEDHQAEIDKRKQQYEDHQEIYSKTAKKLNEAELELSKLKSQLEKQQPEIPEVSKEVANIYEKHKDQHHKLSVILEELYVNTFATFGSSLTQGEVDDIVVAMRTNGYTVAKEKRFYLKNKLTKKFLAVRIGHEVERVKIGDYQEVRNLSLKNKELFKVAFTQQEIDSMETGSYEQIEVEE